MGARRRRILIVVALIALVAVLALRWLSQPSRVAALILSQLGDSLNLDITAAGASEYRLRGTPLLQLRDVVVRERGATAVMLRTERIYVSLPWATIRAGGDPLIAERIELDTPQLDLPALQHWLGTRPPSETKIPTLNRGLRIRDGVIVNNDWRIDGIHADLPSLAPDRSVRARLRGRYADAPLGIPFDLAVAMTKPAAYAGFATNGRVSIEHTGWRLPATVALSGPLTIGDDDLRIAPATLGLSARYESGDTKLPFAIGAHGPLHFDEATWTLAPTAMALRGEGAIPTLDAYGALALGRRLVLQLDGAIAQWPESWPALPPPIGQSSSPLPFALNYVGKPDLSEVAELKLQRDATRFAGRFRLPAVLDWLHAGAQGSPLPPLSGRMSTPAMEISGAQLEGVEVDFGDEGDVE